MIELGPGNLLRTILTLALIYYGGKFLFRWWLKRKVESAVKQQKQTVSENEAQSSRTHEGEVHIKNQNSASSTSSSGGEYVDYEEID